MDLFEGETLKKVRTVEGSLSAVLDAPRGRRRRT
jgi:hypothetical protein